MEQQRRRRLRGLLLVPLFGGIFWGTAFFASTLPGLLVLGVNVHGLGIASYAGDAGASLAPLSPKILTDVNQDTSLRPAVTPPVGPGVATTSSEGSSPATLSQTPSGSPTPTPATTLSPTPTATPAPSASLPLPTVAPLPSILPTPSPTPVAAPTPTPTPSPTPARATINGQVIDTVTQLGIAGAQVTISSGGSTLTDATGNFTFGVNAGSYTLTATATGYSSATQAVNVNGGQKLSVTIKLTSLTATGGIKGIVTSSTGTAIVAAVITLSNGLSTVTDLTGAYSFPAVLYGNYTISASALGYIAQSQLVTVKPGHTTTVNFSLTP